MQLKINDNDDDDDDNNDDVNDNDHGNNKDDEDDKDPLCPRKKSSWGYCSTLFPVVHVLSKHDSTNIHSSI